MESLRLPDELLDAIMSYPIISDDKPTLRSCSLVCRCWVKPAQTYLFQTIEIAVDYRPDQSKLSQSCKRLLQILQLSPHISLYIRHILILFDDDLLQDKSLQALLQLLPALRSLKIRAYTGGYAWQDLPRAFLLSLGSPISNPMFQKLWISGVVFSPSGSELTQFLRYCANSIQALTLSGIYRSYGDDDTTADSVANPVDLTKLRELVVHGDLPAFGGAIKTPNLQFLEGDLTGFTPSGNIVHPFVPKTITSLSLYIGFSNSIMPDAAPSLQRPDAIPNFQLYSELCWIHLKCWYQSDLGPFIQSFRHTPSGNFCRLEYLLVRLKAPLSGEPGDGWDASLWDGFTAALVPLLSLGCFKKFLLMLSYGGDVGQKDLVSVGEKPIGRKRVKDFAAYVRSRLYSLDSKGALELRLWDFDVQRRMDPEFGSLDLLERVMRAGYRL